MKIDILIKSSLALLLMSSSLLAVDIKITEELSSIVTKHKGEEITIERIQDPKHRLENSFSKTSRECPPFCIQPMNIGNVKTIGELEVLSFIKAMENDSTSILMDTRTREWYKNNTIPGSINLPFTMLKKDSKYIDKILTLFGGEKTKEKWSFENVQKLLIFSNGQWDAQASKAIESLIEIGYPENRILYYRGGMQSWQTLGLTVK